ncbi:MAG: peptidoglycan recognition family protein [Minisyncoccia bacterium]|jgi:hypothetical protein
MKKGTKHAYFFGNGKAGGYGSMKDPLWYMRVSQAMEDLGKLRDADQPAYEREKERIYSFVEEQLRLGNVSLGTAGKDFDRERKPIDAIVIHHTSNPPWMTKERLSAIELVRLYAPQYAGKGPTYEANKEIKGAPVYSGHFRNGRQVFWPYHWLVRMDGTCERLLNDDEIGWQAGDWDMNRRSVAICLDNDYEHSAPGKEVLEALARLICERYPSIPKERIFGHCEINHKTTCPSGLFLDGPGGRGWKEKLLGMAGHGIMVQ